MFAVKRALALFSLVDARQDGAPRRAIPCSSLASAGVMSCWLMINLLAYGALVFPSSSGADLVMKRAAAPGSTIVARLPNTPFFGRALARVQGQPAADLANIPITQLGLVLSGVLGNSTGAHASALIAEKGKPAQRYYVGDTLPSDAEVYKVAVDHIVLSRGGKLEKLTYPDVDGRPNVPQKNRVTASYQLGQRVEKAVEAVLKSDSSPAEKQQSIREKLEELREMARQRQEGQRN